LKILKKQKKISFEKTLTISAGDHFEPDHIWSQKVADNIKQPRTWNLTETTAPQISSPTMNCSPSIARTRFSQHLPAKQI
jgi:hypothetical protein